IYDVLGRHVKTLIDQDNHPAGFYDLTWNGHDRNGLEVATGVYFYVLEAETLRQVRKMMLLK
ncbi:MAG: FlgD immunoglobulin-like domain containing protein, partial [Candidatus Latescibacterota bacterium]|nr:FlgD immunoglobulin-like domain containing protein [Candidatus Latescibacterota bacterium]